MKKNIIELENITKNHSTKEKKIEVLQNLNVSFSVGKFYAIMGHSGSGKSTFIKILGLLENINSGKYILYNQNIEYRNCDYLAEIRMKNFGFVFQDFKLNSNLKAYENVMLPMMINPKIRREDRLLKAISLLENLGLKDRINHFPKELSGGEQQRVAIARALANDPDVILADEPTGNLDEEKEKEIFEYLKKLANEGKCVIVVSHSNEIKKYANEILFLKDKKLVGDHLEAN